VLFYFDVYGLLHIPATTHAHFHREFKLMEDKEERDSQFNFLFQFRSYAISRFGCFAVRLNVENWKIIGVGYNACK
jgi:hypothetical protein